MIQLRNILGILIILGIVIISSCLDKIDFVRPESDLQELVIQGVLIKGHPNIVQLEVSNIFDQAGLINPRQVTINQAIISNDKGQTKTLQEVGLGKYEVRIFDGDPDFTIDFQTSYKLFVKAITGEEYESSFETVARVPKLKALKVKKINKKIYNSKTDKIDDVTFLQFRVNTSLLVPNQNQKSNIRWTFEETYKYTDSPTRGYMPPPPKTCYFTERANIVKLQLINGAESVADELNDFVVYERPIGSVLAEGYYLSVIQQSISSSAFEYWDQIREVTGKTGSMFESPAGVVKTNFKTVNDAARPVAGYFYATETDTIRMYISPDFVGNPKRACPPPKFTFGITLCDDCLMHYNSTLTKPSFWIE